MDYRELLTGIKIIDFNLNLIKFCNHRSAYIH